METPSYIWYMNGKKLYMNPDFRRDPKTDRYCANCQKDIKPESAAVRVTIDWETLEVKEDASGTSLIGSDCWKKIKRNMV